MYKIIKIIKNVYGDFLPNDFGLFLRLRDDEHNLNVKIFTHDFNEKFTFLEEENLGFYTDNEILIYNSSKERQTYGIDLKTLKKKYSFDEILYDLNLETRNIYGNYYYNLSEIDNNYIYNLANGDVNKIFENKIVQGYISLINNDFVISKKDSNDLYCYFIKDLAINWQLNANSLFGTENESEIHQTKIYKNSIIVASNKGICSIDIMNGNVNWATKTYALTIEIVENLGYVCTNSALYKINLDTGVISDYDGWEYSALPDIRYKEKNYTAFGYEVIFHEGLLWYRVSASGESFIIAINPHDGYYEWVHHLEGVDKINSIKFHKNRMYLLDIRGILHVYEKDLE